MNFFAFLNGFRKLFVCMVVVTISVIFTITGHLTGDQITKVLTITVPAYFAGNVGEHITNSVKEYIEKKFKKQ